MKDLALTLPTYGPIQPPPGVPTGGLFPTGANLINLILNFLFIAGFVLAIVFILIAGIQWIISSGDKQKLQAARNRLTYSIIGLLVIILSLAIVNIIITLLGGTPRSFLNLPFVGPDFPPGT